MNIIIGSIYSRYREIASPLQALGAIHRLLTYLHDDGSLYEHSIESVECRDEGNGYLDLYITDEHGNCCRYALEIKTGEYIPGNINEEDSLSLDEFIRKWEEIEVTL